MREVAPVGGVEFNGIQTNSNLLGRGVSGENHKDVKPRAFLGGSTPDRLRLFGSHRQRPWV
jgi:hypothetical protein